MKKRNNQHKKGFTLIEILVVIAIIGLLSYFLVPRLLGTQEKAKEAAVKAVMHSVQISIESYNLENSTYPVAKNITLKNLCDYYLLPAGYIGSVPQNPYTGKDYEDADTTGKITYNYDDSTGVYSLIGYNRSGTKKISEITNL
ncbi:MAG: prepilin-type N-terminal cleavage/methylation domain-containing protein [bacterium]